MSKDVFEKQPIPSSLNELERSMKNRAGLGKSYDLGIRKIEVLNKAIHIYYLNGLCDTTYIIEILQTLFELDHHETTKKDIFPLIENQLVNQSIQIIHYIDELVDQVLSGLIVVCFENTKKAIAVDVRSYPGRQPEEPDTEKITRGARDGFVENIIVNTALTRRRIRDERLRFEIMKIGERSKTDVVIGYIKDVANDDLVNIIRQKLNDIKTDGLTMADKTIEEFLVNQGYMLYPLVRYTERADVAANHLLEGHVLIYVDTSPSVIITPTTYFHHVQHAEEYRQSPSIGTIVRWIRFIGIIASIFLVPLWLLFVIEPHLLPNHLEFIGLKESTKIPVIVQVFIAELGIEFLRIASIHTPAPLSTAMGLISAILIGEIAIKVGWLVPEVLLYVAVASIGNFGTPSLELGLANKYSRFLLLIMTAIFHLPGFVIGSTLFLIILALTKSLQTPFLWPFLPFSPGAFLQIIIRRAVPGSNLRPRIIHPNNRVK